MESGKITQGEALDLFEVSRSTLRKARRSGAIGAEQEPDGRRAWLYDLQDLEAKYQRQGSDPVSNPVIDPVLTRLLTRLPCPPIARPTRSSSKPRYASNTSNEISTNERPNETVPGQITSGRGANVNASNVRPSNSRPSSTQPAPLPATAPAESRNSRPR